MIDDESPEPIRHLIATLERADEGDPQFDRVTLHFYQKHGDASDRVGCYHVSELLFGLQQLLEDATRYRSLVATAKDILGDA